MRVLVVGCGSIGTRRAKILSAMGHEVWCFDIDDAAAAHAAVASGGRACDSFSHRDGIGASFVCTPAEFHLSWVRACLTCTGAVFVEKPLALGWDDVTETLKRAEGRVTMGACNLRWAYPAHAPVRHLKLVVSRPLKDWRPDAEHAYRANGIVFEAAIHEIDYAQSVQGPIVDVFVLMRTADRVEIELLHGGGRSSIVIADWSDDAGTERSATFYRADPIGRKHLADTSDAMYRHEMAHFLACVESGEQTCNPLAQAAETLRWALKVNEA